MIHIARNAPYLTNLADALHLSRDLGRTGPVLVRMPDGSAVKITHQQTIFTDDTQRHVAEVVTYPAAFVNWND